MSNVDRLLNDDRTRADTVLRQRFERPTRTSHDESAGAAAMLRDRARFLLDDVSDWHEAELAMQLEARTEEAAKRSVQELLHELAGLGFAWRDIARLVGVTVPAVRKWRNGEAATGQNRVQVARLLAFVDVLGSDHLIQDVASWMEMPISGSTLSGIDVYSMGHAQCLLLLLHGTDHLSGDQLLQRVDPEARHRPDDRFEIVTASDGQPVIRMRSPEPPG